jgi:hypothetical protein
MMLAEAMDTNASECFVVAFVVFCESMIEAEPAEGAFDNPSPRKDRELAHRGTLNGCRPGKEESPYTPRSSSSDICAEYSNRSCRLMPSEKLVSVFDAKVPHASTSKRNLKVRECRITFEIDLGG